MKVCYDFTGTSITSTTLDVEFTPPNGSRTLDITIGAPCVTFDCPDADAVLISDNSNLSQPLDRVVL